MRNADFSFRIPNSAFGILRRRVFPDILPHTFRAFPDRQTRNSAVSYVPNGGSSDPPRPSRRGRTRRSREQSRDQPESRLLAG